MDFIASLQGCPDNPDAHRMLLANCLAQRQALLRGKSLEQALLDVAHIDDRERAAPGAAHGASRRASFLADQLRKLDPRGLGALLALYEHKVFVQSVVWGINPFDQWGVELGRLATGIERELAVPVSAADRGHDASTSYWIDCYRGHAQRRCRAMPGCRASRRICERRQGPASKGTAPHNPAVSGIP